jgi:hypothetical protein
MIIIHRVVSRLIVLSGSQSDAEAAGAEGAPASTRRLQRALLLLAPLLYVFEPLHHAQVSERYLPPSRPRPAPPRNPELSLLCLSLSRARALSSPLPLFPSSPLPSRWRGRRLSHVRTLTRAHAHAHMLTLGRAHGLDLTHGGI